MQEVFKLGEKLMFNQRKISLGILILVFVFVGAFWARAEEPVSETSEVNQLATDGSTEKIVETVESQVQEISEPPPPVEKASSYVNCVVPLELLNMHYKSQMSSVRKMMDRWNEKILFYVKRRDNIRSEMKSVKKEILDLADSEKNKKSKKEASRLNKRLKRLEKDEQAQSKEILKQRKNLVKALKAESKNSQTALKEKFEEVRKKVEITEEK